MHDYGLAPSDFGPSSSSSKVPAGLQIRCWEANQPEKYFTEEQCGMLSVRREERTRARAECLKLLDAMDDLEKLDFLKGDKVEEKEKSAKRVEVRQVPLRIEPTG